MELNKDDDNLKWFYQQNNDVKLGYFKVTSYEHILQLLKTCEQVSFMPTDSKQFYNLMRFLIKNNYLKYTGIDENLLKYYNEYNNEYSMGAVVVYNKLLFSGGVYIGEASHRFNGRRDREKKYLFSEDFFLTKNKSFVLK